MTGILLDTMLLVLLIVGSAGRDLVSKHRRLNDFSPEDYDIISDVLRQYGTVLLTPNTLTEASNLLGYHSEPERSVTFAKLRLLVDENQEIVVPSTSACRNPLFLRLGLTDSVLLEAISDETPLITTDLHLYLTAIESNPRSAINYWHIKEYLTH